jgi:hypothetical protein
MDGSDRACVSPCGYYVLLPGQRLALPVEAIRLALKLEERGFLLSREGEETLVVHPPERLTEEDCRSIRRWKWHLLALLDYRSPRFVQ